MPEKKEETDTQAEGPQGSITKAHTPSLIVDWEFYADYLEDENLSDSQKRELIETIWNIVVAFVDLGFDVQSEAQGCEQSTEKGFFPADDMISSLLHHSNIEQNATNADQSTHDPVDKEES